MTQLTTTGTSKIRMSTLTRLLLLVAALLLVLPTQTRAAETAETILIRAALGKDLSGRRRGDVELLVQAYDQDRFVVYDGGTSASAAGWTPLVTGGDAYGEHVAQQVGAGRGRCAEQQGGSESEEKDANLHGRAPGFVGPGLGFWR